MDLKLKDDCSGVSWKTVSDTLQSVGMANYDPDSHRKAFEASHTVIFVYDSGRLIGFGRALSDGLYQAAVYDCAVAAEYQGRGVGKRIVEVILSRLQGCNVILYATPGKEGFYENFGFRRMKTGMALFKDSKSKRERGFTE